MPRLASPWRLFRAGFRDGAGSVSERAQLIAAAVGGAIGIYAALVYLG